MDLTSIQLSVDDQTTAQNNVAASVAAGIQFVPIDIPGMYWFERATVYETWLIQQVSPGLSSQIDTRDIHQGLTWMPATNTVAGDLGGHTLESLFPTLAVVFESQGTPLVAGSPAAVPSATVATVAPLPVTPDYSWIFIIFIGLVLVSLVAATATRAHHHRVPEKPYTIHSAATF